MTRRLRVNPLRYVVLLAAATLLLSSCIAIVGRAAQMYHIKQEESRLQREVAELAARNAALRTQKDFYNSPTYVERVAREELGLVKPGETGVIVVQHSTSEDAPVVSASQAPAPAATAEAVPLPPVSAWDRWRAWLLGQ